MQIFIKECNMSFALIEFLFCATCGFHQRFVPCALDAASPRQDKGPSEDGPPSDGEPSESGDGKGRGKRREVKDRGVALEVASVPGGTLRLYFNEITEDLYVNATCDCHHDCHKRRTLKKSRTKHAAGKPLGFLVAWLRKGLAPAVQAGTARNHTFGTKITREERRDGRTFFARATRCRAVLRL